MSPALSFYKTNGSKGKAHFMSLFQLSYRVLFKWTVPFEEQQLPLSPDISQVAPAQPFPATITAPSLWCTLHLYGAQHRCIASIGVVHSAPLHVAPLWCVLCHYSALPQLLHLAATPHYTSIVCKNVTVPTCAHSTNVAVLLVLTAALPTHACMK